MLTFLAGFAIGGVMCFLLGRDTRRTDDKRLIKALAERCYGQSQILTRRSEVCK